MNHHTRLFYKEFKSRLKAEYTDTDSCPLPPVSPFIIRIDKKTKQEIKKTVQTLYKMAHSPGYKKLIKTDHQEYLSSHLPNKALLMAYDFHIDKEGRAKLIEVNTQASGFLVSELVDRIHSSSGPDLALKSSPALLKLKQSFEEEWKSFSGTRKKPDHTFIVDHQIPLQKMYIEFLMFKSLLHHHWGWPCKLMEVKDFKLFKQEPHHKKTVMVYNRLTDFYFESWPILKKAFLNQGVFISPHPKEYLLLADKNRLVEWSNPSFLDQTCLNKEEKSQLQQALLPAGYVHSLPAKVLWKKRKELFFKPLRGYGGKAVYKGKSLSRKMFERILKTPALFQQAQAPLVFIDPEGEKWKYDIRAYVYGGEVQKLSARVYQGQVTGFQTPLSGFATLQSN